MPLPPNSGVNWDYDPLDLGPAPPYDGVPKLLFWSQDEDHGSFGRTPEEPFVATVEPEAVAAIWMPFDPQRIVDMACQATDTPGGSFVVLDDGSLWGWGWDWLGNSSGSKSALPMTTDSDPDPDPNVSPPVLVGPSGTPIGSVERVSAGGFSAAARKTDKSIWVWGWGGYTGRLGYGDTVHSSGIPRAHGQVTASDDFLMDDDKMAFLIDGTVYEIGSGAGGDPTVEGSNSGSSPYSTVLVPKVGPGGSGNLSATSLQRGGGDCGTSALANDGGTLYGWGNTAYGALGNGTASDWFDDRGLYNPSDIAGWEGWYLQNWPTAVVGVDGDAVLTGVVDFHLTTRSGAALLDTGDVVAWGHLFGPLNPSGYGSDALCPWRLPTPPSPVVEITVAGISNWVVAIRCEDGCVYVIGGWLSSVADPISGVSFFHPQWHRLGGVNGARMIRGGVDTLMVVTGPTPSAGVFFASSQIG